MNKYRRQQHVAAAAKLHYEREIRKAELTDAVKEAISAFELLRQRRIFLDKQRAMALEKVRVTEAAKRFAFDREKYFYPDILQENFTAWQQLVLTNQDQKLWRYKISLAYLKLLYVSGMLHTNAPFFKTETERHTVPRALWVYDKSWINNLSKQTEVVRFCHTNNVNTVFLATGSRNDSLSIYQATFAYNHFIRSLHRSGISVQLVLGDAVWVLPDRWAEVKWRLDYLAEFYSQQTPFDGLQFDIEPQMLTDWRTSRDQKEMIIKHYIHLTRKIHQYMAEHMSKVTFSLAIPAWFEKEKLSTWERGDHILSRIIPVVDEIAVMAYQPDIATIRAAVSEELLQARIHNKRIWIGLKVRSNATASGFNTADLDKLNQIMDSLYQFYRELFPELNGFALYSYEKYHSLVK